MKFTKMHGAGNDYVYINGFEEIVADPSALAARISDRHFGIGSDGLIMVLPSETADLRMRIFNADGSEAEVCGNGIRCLAKYAFEHGIMTNNPMRVETAAGMREVELFLEGDKVTRAKVKMGVPRLAPDDIPVRLKHHPVVEYVVDISQWHLSMTCVNMGNPHAVFFIDDIAEFPLKEIGPLLEHDPLFPERVNVHIVQVLSRNEVRMRTWERGSGMTLACGTGAAAVCVAGVLTDRTERKVEIHVPGGELDLEWAGNEESVYMTGPCEEVFTGNW
ncbi:MAG: diaminopimelate epimerase, partial [Phycisphaerae bacterium]|nr:diaminopimelate epimerase [Phycisphaerae bacterium]